jgi:hypothetical protein
MRASTHARRAARAMTLPAAILHAVVSAAALLAGALICSPADAAEPAKITIMAFMPAPKNKNARTWKLMVSGERYNPAGVLGRLRAASLARIARPSRRDSCNDQRITSST